MSRGSLRAIITGGAFGFDEQTKHILKDREGHLPDTPENREMLEGLVNEDDYLGPDRHGNRWYADVNEDGQQVWISVQNGVIQNAGANAPGEHRVYNDYSGLAR